MEILDPEIKAMYECYNLTKDLDENSKVRVVRWLIDRLQLPSLSIKTKSPSGGSASTGHELDSQHSNEENEADEEKNGSEDFPKTIADFETVAEAFAAANPSTDWEKSLVVATYLQQKNGLSEIKGFDVNKELKNLGHGMTHITHTFDTCIAKRPQLVLQLRKEGKTRQAQKKYKVTGEGIKIVNAMIIQK